MPDPETPIEEWRTSKPNAKGNTYEYVVLKGAGGGVLRRQGDETPDQARIRHAVLQETKRRKQRDGALPPKKERPKGKGREPDKPPVTPKAKQSAPKRDKPTPAQLAAAAELPLEVLGTFIGHSMLGCSYCAASMRAAAGPAARDLANTTNPYLLRLLEWWQGVLSVAMKGGGFTQFVGVPLIHHAAPDPMYQFVAPFMGMPARPSSGARGGHVHQPPPPTAPPPGMMPVDPVSAGAGRVPPSAAGPPPTAEDMMREQAARTADEARIAALNELAAREQARARELQGATANVPSYRAADTLTPAQQRQMMAAAESRNIGGGIPNYNGQGNAPGTPQAPPTSPTDSPIPTDEA